MGFGDVLANVGNIAGAFANLKRLIGLSNDKTYPDHPITNKINYNDGNWRKSLGYSFQVVRVDSNGKIIPNQAEGEGWSEFRLQINPQELSQDEIFAIQVTPTFRGVVVEHQGVTLKDIMLSGTTGLSPLRKEGGTDKTSGAAVMASGHSGYEEFNELRSYFRVYVEKKRLDDRTQGELRMIFRNYKDNEHIFVEPQKFTMKRSAGRPFLYDYSIALKGIGVAIEESNGSFLNTLTKIADIIDRIIGLTTTADQVIRGSIGIIRRFENDIYDTILDPLRTINDALIQIRGGQEAFLGNYSITRRYVDQLQLELNRVEANYNDALGRNTEVYNEAIGHNTTLEGKIGRESTFSELELLNAISKAKRGISLLLGQQALFEKDVFKLNQSTINAYNGKVDLINPSSTRTVTILGGDTLQTVASRELGDPDRYRELIILNNLKPPYIADTASQGVLAPGQSIYIPQTSPTKRTGAVKGKSFNITQFLSESEKNLGVDIKITNDGDLAISNTGDLELVAGTQNMAQAIIIRLLLEKGSLKRHQGIGTTLKIGGKSTARGLQSLRDQVVSSLSSDPRIQSVPFVELKQDGSTTLINLLIKMKNLNEPVPVPITINNNG